MSTRTVFSFLISLFFLAAAAVQADPINLSATRSVTIGDRSGSLSGANSPSTVLGGFSDSVTGLLGPNQPKTTSASQHTDIQAGTGIFAGRGESSVGFSVLNSDQVVAESFFDVSFDLTDIHSYSLTGLLTANMDGGYGESLFRLSDGGSTNILFSILNYGDDVVLNSSGTLNPGSYHLLVSSIINNNGDDRGVNGYMGGTTSFSFNLDLDPVTSTVPEPATWALLLSGLAGLRLLRHRGRTA